jgi:hypothetical protein
MIFEFFLILPVFGLVLLRDLGLLSVLLDFLP